MTGRNRGQAQGNEQHFYGKSRENMTEGNNRRKLFVGNLTRDIHEDDIRQAFGNFHVENVYMIPGSGKKPFCFVVLDSFEAAQEATKALDGSTIKGQTICIRPATTRKEPGTGSVGDCGPTDWSRGTENGSSPSSVNKEGREIFVSSLPDDIEENDIVELFDSFGLERVVLKKSDKKRPFAFVTLYDKQVAASAIAKLNAMSYRGHSLLVALTRGKQAAPASETSTNGPPMLAPIDPRPPSDAPVVELYVGNLPNGCTEHDVRQAFSDLDVDYVQIKAKGDRTFSFVGLRYSGTAEEVLSVIGRREVNGRNLVMRTANPSGSSSMLKGPNHQTPPVASNPPWENETSASPVTDSWDSRVPASEVRVGSAPVSAGSKGGEHGGGKLSAAHSWGGGDHAERLSANSSPPPLELIDDDSPVANGICNYGGDSSDCGIQNGDLSCNELFVDNLRRGITGAEVRDMFEKFGVSAVELKNLAKKSFAFVTLAREGSAQEAINELNGKTGTDGRPITVRRKELRSALKGGGQPGALRKSDPARPSTPVADNMVHVSNLPRDVGEEDIARLFEKYGVREVHLVSDTPDPYAFVVLSSAEGQRKALEDLQGASMCGKKLFVCPSLEKNGPGQQQKTRGALLETPSRCPVVLCVANYPYSSREHHLMELLENFSPLEIVIIPPKYNDHHNYTRAYVSVPSWEHAEDAVLELDNTYFYGRLIAVVPMAEGTAAEIAAFDPSRRKQ